MCTMWPCIDFDSVAFVRFESYCLLGLNLLNLFCKSKYIDTEFSELGHLQSNKFTTLFTNSNVSDVPEYPYGNNFLEICSVLSLRCSACLQWFKVKHFKEVLNLENTKKSREVKIKGVQGTFQQWNLIFIQKQRYRKCCVGRLFCNDAVFTCPAKYLIFMTNILP
jgi:hypothetical protein